MLQQFMNEWIHHQKIQLNKKYILLTGSNNLFRNTNLNFHKIRGKNNQQCYKKDFYQLCSLQTVHTSNLSGVCEPKVCGASIFVKNMMSTIWKYYCSENLHTVAQKCIVLNIEKKDSLITHILFELQTIIVFSLVANFGDQSLKCLEFNIHSKYIVPIFEW